MKYLLDRFDIPVVVLRVKESTAGADADNRLLPMLVNTISTLLQGNDTLLMPKQPRSPLVPPPLVNRLQPKVHVSACSPPRRTSLPPVRLTVRAMFRNRLHRQKPSLDLVVCVSLPYSTTSLQRHRPLQIDDQTWTRTTVHRMGLSTRTLAKTRARRSIPLLYLSYLLVQVEHISSNISTNSNRVPM